MWQSLVDRAVTSEDGVREKEITAAKYNEQ